MNGFVSYILGLCQKKEGTEVEFKSELGGFPGRSRKKTRKEIRYEIKEIIRENPEVSIATLTKTIGVTPKSVEWHISKMEGGDEVIV